MSAGAVNHSSPVPLTRITKSLPLRLIAHTTVEFAIFPTGSMVALPAAITRLRKN